MNNEYEVELWVEQHPKILNLAKEIQSAKSTLINEKSQEFSSYSSSSNTAMPPEIVDDQVIYENMTLHEDSYFINNIFKFSTKSFNFKMSIKHFSFVPGTIRRSCMKN